MYRTWFSLAVVLSSSSLLLVDSAVKGAAILSLAALATLALWRDSAATRHLTWLVAIIGMLAMPVFSATLPQWRVLPSWIGNAAKPMPSGDLLAPRTWRPSPEVASPNAGVADSPIETAAIEVPAAVAAIDLQPEPSFATAEPDAAPAVKSNSEPIWPLVLSLIWASGCLLLMLRLLAARLMLWSSERRGTVIAVCRVPQKDWRAAGAVDVDQTLVNAFQDACQTLGIRQTVHLLIHPDRTIPVVWGVFRLRLLLPTESRQWSVEQLRSVLLHELAHIKRRDTIAQLLTQLACGLHWFNPLVWIAAWRMHVERERACDDLVLASGVRPSAYAKHLLNVTTHLSASPWSQACELAMASGSSLESRLTAVLSTGRNRRHVTSVVAALSLMLGAGIAIPIAMLRAAETQLSAEESEGVDDDDDSGPGDKNKETKEKGKAADDKDKKPESSEKPNVAAKTPAPAPAATPAVLAPKNDEGAALFKIWQANARTDGKIPGALIGRLGGMVEYFIDLNKDDQSGSSLASRFVKLLPRFDASHDWTQPKAVALIDEVSAIHRIPLRNTLEAARERAVLTGEPLPAELTDAPWGKPAANGLRVAWLLEPRAKEYHMGATLKSRILVHNSGNQQVFFIMPSWQQSGAHKAHDAAGKAIKVPSTYWTTMASLRVYRLAPGAYCETPAPGVGVGRSTKRDDWANLRPGAWVEAQVGDEVRFTPGPIEVRFSPSVVGTRIIKGRPDNVDPKNAADLWDRMVTERVEREMPIPDGAADREQLLRRVVNDLYGLQPNDSEIRAFVNDRSPATQHPVTSVELVKIRVKHLRNISAFTGVLPGGDIKFRVLAADPNAADRPRVVTGPGHYTLGNQIRLHVAQTRVGKRRTNKATIRFYASSSKVKPPKPVEISLPDGYLTYAIAWERDASVLWVSQTGLLRSFDFSNPTKVKEERFEAGAKDLPAKLREAITAVLPRWEQAKPSRPHRGVKLDPTIIERLQWGQPVDGLRAALVRPAGIGDPETDEVMDFRLVIQNVGKSDVRFKTILASGRTPTLKVRDSESILMMLSAIRPGDVDYQLQPGNVAVMRLFAQINKGRSISYDADFTFSARLKIDKAPTGAWTGQLDTAELTAALLGHGQLPKHKRAQELFKNWNTAARWNGMIPGAVVGQLAEAVKTFTKFNPTADTTPRLLELLARLDSSRDWSGTEALSMLDELAALQASPIDAVLEAEMQRTIRAGSPLPNSLKNSPWGESHPSGLRMAWLLEPTKAEQSVGAELKSRILIHNTGSTSVVFQTNNWHQYNGHQVFDGKNNQLNVTSTRRLGRRLLYTFRLRPGEYVEVPAAGIGVGPRNNQTGVKLRVGFWIDAKPGDTVRFVPSPVVINDGKSHTALIGERSWWREFVTARVHRELPLPQDADLRMRLLYRVSMDLFGTPVGGKVRDEFLADRKPNALDTLAMRLAENPRAVSFSGSLQSAATTFRVAAAAPDARE